MAQKKQAEKKEQQTPVEVRELMERKQIETMFTLRAWYDEDFRKALLDDPKGTLEKTLNVKLPNAMKITVVEEKLNEIRVSLPVRPAGAGELNDEQLEAVAGGRGDGGLHMFFCHQTPNMFMSTIHNSRMFLTREYWERSW